MRMSWRCAGRVPVALLVVAGCATPTSQSDVVPSRFVERPTVSSEARAAYGDRAERAYEEMSSFVVQGLRPDLLDPQRTTFTPTQLSDGIVDRLTPAARQVWNHSVTQALAGDAAARQQVYTLRPFRLDAPGTSLPKKGSAVESQTTSAATISLAPGATAGSANPPLQVSFDHEARLNLADGNTSYPGTLSRRLTFVVVPAASGTAPTAAPTGGTGGTAGTPSASAPTWLIDSVAGQSTVEFDKAEETDDPSESRESTASATS